MNTTTIMQLHHTLEKAGKGEAQEIRQHAANSVGHQGDIYIHPIKKRPEVWNVETTDQSRQVAVGQGEGSHHCVSGKVKVFWPESAAKAAGQCPLEGFFSGEENARRVCLGPIIEAKEPFTVTHPKHAHHEFPAGTYLVTFQLDRRTMRQVRD